MCNERVASLSSDSPDQRTCDTVDTQNSVVYPVIVVHICGPMPAPVRRSRDGLTARCLTWFVTVAQRSQGTPTEPGAGHGHWHGRCTATQTVSRGDVSRFDVVTYAATMPMSVVCAARNFLPIPW
jgi:hypothetical protein